jgi:hypothetical protein
MTAEELLLSVVSALNNIVSEIDDSGDRVFFGSTNDADLLKEIAQRLDDWRFEQAEKSA